MPALQCVLNLQLQLRSEVLQIDAGGADELAAGDEAAGVGPADAAATGRRGPRRRSWPGSRPRGCKTASGTRPPWCRPGPGQARPTRPGPVCRRGSTGPGAWNTIRSWHRGRNGNHPRRREPEACGPGPAGRDRQGSPPWLGGHPCGTGWRVRCTAPAGSTPPSGRSPRPRTGRRRRRDRPGRGCRPRCGIPDGQRPSAAPAAPIGPSLARRRSQPDLPAGEPASSHQRLTGVLDGEMPVGIDRRGDRSMPEEFLHGLHPCALA